MHPALRCLASKKKAALAPILNPMNKMEQMISVLVGDPRFSRSRNKTITNITNPEVISLYSAPLYLSTLTVYP